MLYVGAEQNASLPSGTRFGSTLKLGRQICLPRPPLKAATAEPRQVEPNKRAPPPTATDWERTHLANVRT